MIDKIEVSGTRQKRFEPGCEIALVDEVGSAPAGAKKRFMPTKKSGKRRSSIAARVAYR
jgi:hypothetical protein